MNDGLTLQEMMELYELWQEALEALRTEATGFGACELARHVAELREVLCTWYASPLELCETVETLKGYCNVRGDSLPPQEETDGQ